MDWIRRNWPDLLIGIALVAVIAGIIATLLTGGSFFPLGASQASSSRPEQSSTSTFDPGPSTERAGSNTPTSNEPSSNTPTSNTPTSNTATSNTASSNSSTSESEGDPTPAGTAAVAENSEGPVSVSALPLPGTSTEGSGEAQASGEASAPAPEQTTSGSRSIQLPDPDEAGSYRISVGAFTGEENAARQAGTFRDAGYPVFIGTQGDLSIVLVGPYEDLPEAERVAARIRNGGFRIEPVIYRFQADSESGSTTASASSSTAPTPRPTAAEATAGSFLQVGAYATRESAQPQRQRLEGLGFRVSERVEGDLVKLLVGPFASAEMTDARALLNEQGIDHFPR